MDSGRAGTETALCRCSPALMKGTNSRYTQTLKERPFPSKRGMSYPPMSCRAICGRELACPSMDTALCVRI